jgi:hypothetical protein
LSALCRGGEERRRGGAGNGGSVNRALYPSYAPAGDYPRTIQFAVAQDRGAVVADCMSHYARAGGGGTEPMAHTSISVNGGRPF